MLSVWTYEEFEKGNVMSIVHFRLAKQEADMKQVVRAIQLPEFCSRDSSLVVKEIFGVTDDDADKLRIHTLSEAGDMDSLEQMVVGGFFTYWDGVIETWLRGFRLNKIDPFRRYPFSVSLNLIFLSLHRCLCWELVDGKFLDKRLLEEEMQNVLESRREIEIINGIFSNAVSFFMKWLWSLKSTTKTAISGRPMMKFESGYTVETVFDGSKLGSLPLFLYKVAANYLWLASKLEESPRKARQVLNVFHKIECRMENLPIEHLEIRSQKYPDLKTDLSRAERHIFKEMGFVCHVEHPHAFISKLPCHPQNTSRTEAGSLESSK
nr:isoform 2 of cyclin-l1-1 [Quercus suber]